MVEGVRLRLPGRTAFERDAVNLVRANTEGDATVDAVPVALLVALAVSVCVFGLVVLFSPNTNKRGRFFFVMLRGCRLVGCLVTQDFLPL